MAVGETSSVTITFNEAVSGLTTADFTVANGALSSLSSADGGITWTATLTPSIDTEDTTNLISLDNTGVMDAAGNTGTSNTDSNNYAIDTARPTVSIVVADTTLAIGETSLVTITFSEAVSGFTNADLTVANGTLSSVSSADGGITWTARLTPTTGITDTSNLITLDNTGVQDAADNTGSGTTDSNNYAIDTKRPTVVITLSDETLTAGETTTVIFTFSEQVSGFSNADLTITNGTLSAVSSTDGGTTWTAIFTPDTDIESAANVIAINNTGYVDAAGNAGTATTYSANIIIDTQTPTITSVTVPANGTYVAGQNLDFTVNLSEAVVVDTVGGIPRIAITLDTGGTAFANYVSGSGTSALVFRLTVANGQLDSNGISVGNSINLHGATLRDAVGNNATTTLNGVGATGGVRVDALAPLAQGLVRVDTSPTTASSVQFTLTLSEAVSGVDASDFSVISTGGAVGTIQSVMQIDSRTYRITVSNVAGNGSLGISLNAAGSGIADTAGNALAASIVGEDYVIAATSGDPEFKSSPPVINVLPPSPALPPTPPPLPPAPTSSPLLPTPLFEQPTLGSGIPTLGNIFINNGTLASSFIAQVFASSSNDVAGNASGGFLGFGGGDGGVFGASTLANIFGSDSLPESTSRNIFNDQQWDKDGRQTPHGVLGAPTLGQQLDELRNTEQRHLRELALALGQFETAGPHT
ncbi:Ig-like domain-containing protein [Pseudomonas taeanensis]|uniref:Ig-like domain-containing protein n=1 Tax=Pseudomonas taeanensis TaxID=574962 RepID=UPI0004AFD064|nr:Ig-like domain-containing protein [Pseudomonas taeanensis]